MASSKAPTLPFEVGKAPDGAAAQPGGPFTLEHYASLCTELGLWPNLAPEILARYGLSRERKVELDRRFKAEMATDRAAYERWRKASEAYLGWLLSMKVPDKQE